MLAAVALTVTIGAAVRAAALNPRDRRVSAYQRIASRRSKRDVVA
jgi:hypothetical protein